MTPSVERYAMIFWAGLAIVALLLVFWWGWLHNASIAFQPASSLLKYVDMFLKFGSTVAVVLLTLWVFAVDSGDAALRWATLATSIGWIVLSALSARYVVVTLLEKAGKYKHPPTY